MVSSGWCLVSVCVVLTVLAAATGAAPADPLAAEEAAQRSERSANLSHITGTSRKIRMYVKNRFLQLMPDGTVNGTVDDTTVFSILQRQSVRVGQVKIQGVATCMYLCMDSCGLLYASRDFAEDCVFNEMIEQHHYNTYSSTKYSNHRRTVYLALNRKGVPRRVQIKATAPLGKLSTYTRVLTQPVPGDEVDQLARRLLQQHPAGTGQHHLRHHQMCPPAARGTLTETADPERCRKRKKRRKRRKCREGEEENEDCHKPKEEGGKKRTVIVRKRCEEGEGKERCQQKKVQMIGRKRKSRHDKRLQLRHLQTRSHQRSEEEESEEVVDHEETTLDEDDAATTDSATLLEENDD